MRTNWRIFWIVAGFIWVGSACLGLLAAMLIGIWSANGRQDVWDHIAWTIAIISLVSGGLAGAGAAILLNLEQEERRDRARVERDRVREFSRDPDRGPGHW